MNISVSGYHKEFSLHLNQSRNKKLFYVHHWFPSEISHLWRSAHELLSVTVSCLHHNARNFICLGMDYGPSIFVRTPLVDSFEDLQRLLWRFVEIKNYFLKFTCFLFKFFLWNWKTRCPLKSRVTVRSVSIQLSLTSRTVIWNDLTASLSWCLRL